MQAIANSTLPRLGIFRLPEFLRREMMPTPGRWQATLRITLSCVVCTVPIMVFHLQEPLLVMILMYLLAREDSTTTLIGSAMAMLGATLGCAALLIYYVTVIDIVWLRVLSIPAFIALALFLNRIITAGPIGTAVAQPLALGMVLPDVVSSTEYLTRFPFYIWWSALLGLATNFVVQLLLNPQTSQSLLVRGLTSRLDAVEALLRRLAAGDEVQPPQSVLAPLALAGAVEQLQRLKLAGAVEPWLKTHRSELSAQIILVDRLVTAGALLEVEGIVVGQESTRERMWRIADACARWRTATFTQRVPETPSVLGHGSQTSQDFGSLPALAEMERVIELVPLAFQGGDLPEELKLVADKQGGLLVPDAFVNREYLQFAVKGALAGFICYLIFTLTAYQAIYTSVITVIVCALSTIGASVQKGTLRFAGAAVGGALGVITLVFIFPHLDSLGGFWFPFAGVTGLAAYVNFGSPRISYLGHQIGLAFYKCVLQSYGPYTELRVVRDRLIGIALGLAVFGLINSQLWPVRAAETMRVKLADIFGLLARLAGLPDENKSLGPQMAVAYKLRLQAYRHFGTIREMLESSKFERGSAAREKLAAISQESQRLLLELLAIIQHRPDLRPDAVPEPLRVASAHFRATVADVLEILADRVQGRTDRPMPNLQPALEELEESFAAQIKHVTESDRADHLRGRLSLYRETVSTLTELVRLEAGQDRS